MKRRLEETVKIVDTSGGYPHPLAPLSPPRHQPLSLTTVGQSSYLPIIKPGELRSVQSFTTFSPTMPAVTPSIKSIVAGGLQGGDQPHPMQVPPSLHHKVHGGSMTPPISSTLTPAQQQQQIQRLKVEDALSYLDMVKFKFGDQPQVYNDFLDIMKEFKSQSIDTPGVIDRVSSLFKGHPELIVGFNTFLPPGYKIEVKTNEQGYSFQVQVSIPSPTSGTTTMVPTGSTVHHSAQLANTVMPIVTTVVSKPLIISNTVVTHVNSGQPVVASTVVPVASTTPPHFSNHTTATITEVQAHQAVSQALSHVDSSQPPTPQSQPVEFNHAINYVNKIKNRFQGQPDKYKRFLEILHTYQKEQRNLKEGMIGPGQSAGTKQLTEAEVYAQVAKLFEHQEDLLAEFGQFLPDATNHQTQLTRRCEEPPPVNRKPSANVKITSPFNNNSIVSPSASPVTTSNTPPTKLCGVVHNPTPPPQTEPSVSPGQKRSPSMTLHHPLPSTSQHSSSVPPIKKQKLNACFRDVTLADAAKYGSLTDFSFFDKVRKALRSQDVYENFLRCINLFTQEVVSGTELMQMITPFLGHSPELFRWFKEYMGYAESPLMLPIGIASPPQNTETSFDSDRVNSISRPDRSNSEQSEIDFSSCKRLGASYCALPRSHQQERCSGRNALCREVLNDTWVSFPTWSEESTFVTSRKTQYEESMYRCEDERFELDVVLEVNSATIRVLEGVQKKICRMSADEVAKFTLDDCLGGNSPTIHQRALLRIYGDKGHDIIDGLKKNPFAALPVVLKRLKAKDEEWREAQKGFNKHWREQNEKYYLKSLDHQGINFKQNDLKTLRSKTLFNEIEACYDEVKIAGHPAKRHEQAAAGDPAAVSGPNMTFVYKDKSVLDDAANLLIHHVKRQTSIHKEDKQRIKHMLRQHLPDMFLHPRQELSEDERGPETKGRSYPSPHNNDEGPNHKNKSDERTRREDNEDIKLPIHALCQHPEEEYTLFFGNGHWYLFLRLHHILCERLTHIYDHANILVREEDQHKGLRTDAVSTALRLMPKSEFLVDISLDDYYTTFLDMVKNLLDGNMDSNAYEDTLREMFGIHAYLAFTLDKVVSYAVRQLQHLVADDACTECTDMYLKNVARGGAGGLCANAYSRLHSEAAYQRKAEQIMAEEGENCYKFFIYKINCKVTIELLESDSYDHEKNQRDAEKWSAYVDRFAKTGNKDKHEMDIDDDVEVEQERRLWGKAIFLPRNIRLWHDRVGNNRNNFSKIDSCDETECKFNLNSYKMVFVLDRESYLYKRRALLKARQCHEQLSYRMSTKFHMWHRTWAQNNLTPHQYEFADNWMMGNLPDYKMNHTVVLRDNPVDKPPYHSFNRFRVYDKSNK